MSKTHWSRTALLGPLAFVACSEGSPGELAAEVDALDVTQSGCAQLVLANDGIDDAPGFACALARLAPNGGVLNVPPGRYNLHATLVVPDRVIVQGSGFATEFAQPHSLLGPLLRLQRESGLRDVMLSQEQPLPAAGWAPYSDYDFQIKVEGDQTTVADIKLLNPYRGILISPASPDGAVGQIQLFNIRGQPLKEGIRIDHALDVVHILEVHFWPFWSAAPEVLQWTARNGTGLISLRNDNPMFEKMFFFAYSVGILFERSTEGATSGVTSKPKVAQMDCDACQVAVQVNSDGSRGILLSQVSTQGPKNDFGIAHGSVALFINANNVSLLADQLDFTHVGANAVRVQGSNTSVSVENSMIREWNVSGRGFPAFERVDGFSNSSLRARGIFVGDGHGAPLSNAAAQVADVLPL